MKDWAITSVLITVLIWATIFSHYYLKPGGVWMCECTQQRPFEDCKKDLSKLRDDFK